MYMCVHVHGYIDNLEIDTIYSLNFFWSIITLPFVSILIFKATYNQQLWLFLSISYNRFYMWLLYRLTPTNWVAHFHPHDPILLGEIPGNWQRSKFLGFPQDFQCLPIVSGSLSNFCNYPHVP